jgi:hypothetical protein
MRLRSGDNGSRERMLRGALALRLVVGFGAWRVTISGWRRRLAVLRFLAFVCLLLDRFTALTLSP